ncbi:MAG: hypothetical protein JNL58_17630 [Planctomyces sp.]|nr:hypothetical protein [Planctomyces sp.]
MPGRNHNRSVVIKRLLIALLFCTCTALNAQSPDSPAPRNVSPPQPAFRKFTFKHANAADVLKLLMQLEGLTKNEVGPGFAVDERTNSFIYQNIDDEQQALMFEEMCTLLDAESPNASATNEGISLTVPAMGPEPLTFDFSFGIVRGDSVDSLRQQYNELEQRTHQLADRLKQSTSLGESQRNELELAVRKSFEARQTLQRAELADLARRMTSMQQSIDMRDKLADKVVERRVEELLSPGLTWDPLKDREQTLSGSSNSNSELQISSPQPSANPLSNGPVDQASLPQIAPPTPRISPYRPGERPENVIKARMQGRWIADALIEGNKDSLSEYSVPMEVLINNNEMRFVVGEQDIHGPMLLANVKDDHSSLQSIDQPLPIDVIIDPNGEHSKFCGIIACDGATLSLCMAADEGKEGGAFRPTWFIPGSKVVLLKCHRSPGTAAKTTPQEIDLSTPQATLDYLHRDSIAHPNNVPSETEPTAEVPVTGTPAAGISAEQTSTLPTEPLEIKLLISEKNSPALRVSYDDIDLMKVLNMEPVPVNAVEYFPEWLKGLDGATIRIRGFMYPTFEATGLTGFTLARDNGICCFVRQPKIYDIIAVELAPGVTSDYIEGKPFDVEGTFRIQPEADETALYRLFRIENARVLRSQVSSAISPTVPDSAGSASSISPSASPPNSETPEVLIARLNECGRNGSYKEFVALFTKEGIRDLAGSLMMSALQLNGLEEAASMPAPDGSTKLDSGVTAVREVLQRWLPQTADPEQSKAMKDGLSTMLNAIGGTPPNPSEVQGFVVSMRKSVEGIDDHGKFCIEMMQAYETLTSKPFVYFDSAGPQPEWQVSQFGERAIATLGDGSPHSTTITLQHTNGTWRISSLYNELLNGSNPAEQSPGAASVESSDSRTVTRRYSVGSFVTETYFTGKGSYDLQEVYEKYETEIEQSLQDLAKTVTAACSRPPRFVQVLSSSRALLVGHTVAGHQEIADFMSDIGISNDRIRLRGECIAITSEDATTIGLELTQRVLSPEDIEKLRVFAKSDSAKSRKSEKEKSNDMFINLAVMDETILSGTRTPLKNSGLIPLSIAARIIPGTETIQLRFDTHGLEKNGVEYIAPLFQSVGESQAALLPLGEDFYWIVTADIVHLPNAGANRTDQANETTPASAATEMQQRLQGEWDVTVAGFSGDMSDKRPYQAVVRGQLFLLQVMEDGKVLGTSPFKIIWPEPDHPDVVDIVWDPNNNRDDHFCPGRITCDGKSFRLAWRSDDSISGPAIRPTEICSGEGISYFECVRK